MEEKNDDHNQDCLMKEVCYAYGHGHLSNIFSEKVFCIRNIQPGQIKYQQIRGSNTSRGFKQAIRVLTIPPLHGKKTLVLRY